jgi:diguanylate cyclase (GGDEF)-like protein
MLLVTSLGVLVGAVVVIALRGDRRRLLAQAITDPLTGAFNRRHMSICLTAAIERRRRTGESASLLLFDIDHFKRINDTFGHASGDAVLADLAALVARRVRRMDAFFRLGGEEFVLLLPGAARDGALAVAETLRASVAAADFGDGRRISISVGVCELRPEHTVSSWIADADAALYDAKHSGRNRVSASHRVPPAFGVMADRNTIAPFRPSL